MPLLQTGDLLAQRCLRFEERLAAPFLAIKRVECLELDVEREERLDRLSQRVEL